VVTPIFSCYHNATQATNSKVGDTNIPGWTRNCMRNLTHSTCSIAHTLFAYCIRFALLLGRKPLPNIELKASGAVSQTPRFPCIHQVEITFYIRSRQMHIWGEISAPFWWIPSESLLPAFSPDINCSQATSRWSMATYTIIWTVLSWCIACKPTSGHAVHFREIDDVFQA